MRIINTRSHNTPTSPAALRAFVVKTDSPARLWSESPSLFMGEGFRGGQNQRPSTHPFPAPPMLPCPQTAA